MKPNTAWPRTVRGLFVTVTLLVQSVTVHAFPVESGGATTVHKSDVNAFSMPSANMSFERRIDFSVGNSFFRNPWVSAPSSTTARDGLGPLFNTNACQNCHIKDGRGHLPDSRSDNAVSTLLRISVAPVSPQDWQQVQQQGVIPDPHYGDQIQDFSLPDMEPEARIQIDYSHHQTVLDDGTRVDMRLPVVQLSRLAYGPLHPDLQMSLRVAPPMIGLGLLEAIPETTLREWSDEQDADGDGISGKLNQVWDQESRTYRAGRFGWKAEQPSLKQQNAAAFKGDLGVTTVMFDSENCQPAQTSCRYAQNGGMPEASERILELVTFYSRNLAVPARRNSLNPAVKRGEAVFETAGCSACHKTAVRTATLARQPEQSDQLIYPYTDLLLHDMGEGLADHRPVFSASGTEWRTPPLWGIGLTRQVSGYEHYLHDGRARTLLEAVLWHDGEAAASRQRVQAMTATERDSLLQFLQSL